MRMGHQCDSKGNNKVEFTPGNKGVMLQGPWVTDKNRRRRAEQLNEWKIIGKNVWLSTQRN